LIVKFDEFDELAQSMTCHVMSGVFEKFDELTFDEWG
jgi:hypothetical protein